jgi:hypothetical protein
MYAISLNSLGDRRYLLADIVWPESDCIPSEGKLRLVIAVLTCSEVNSSFQIPWVCIMPNPGNRRI